MSLRTNARYAFGLVFTRFMPLNDDLTIPIPTRLIGGAGPFDFSGEASAAAIPLTIKIDNNAEETVNIDLSGAVDISAVTAKELRDAINAANPTDMIASIETDSGRIQLAYDATDDVGYIQVYNHVGIIALFGQGFPLKFVKTDTLRSIGDTPTLKDEETLTTTDAKGLDTSVISDGYRKGFTATVVDTAEDWLLKALMEGGHYDQENGIYEVPTSEDEKIYFYVEAYYTRYTRGENKEADLVSYVQKLYRSCKGAVGDITHERGFGDGNYTITGTTYKDQNNELYADTKLTELSVEEYEALDVLNV